MTKINPLQLILMSVLIYPLTPGYGILGTGIAAAVPFALVLVLILSFSEAGRIIDRSFLTIVKNIAPATVGSLIMVSLLLQQLISHLPPALVLVLSIGLGAVSYSVFTWLTQKEDIREIRRTGVSIGTDRVRSVKMEQPLVQ